ncbi:MAG: hypothetical protein ABIP44_10580 [Pseudoxanthomonas sp.]
MSNFKTLAMATLCLAAATGAGKALAQSTDGYHAIQVFPIAVDSASFTQRFTFRNGDATNAITVAVKYFPGTGTTQAAAISCPSVVLPANGQVVFTSLRALCPALAPGSQFGFVYTNDSDATRKRPYAAYSRVSNAQGIGFSVEGFPAHTFTSADGVVTGVRRIAAAGGAPAYQTNCFVGKMNDVSPSTAVDSSVLVTVRNSAGTILGATTTFTVGPGKLTRLLDVFAAVGAPAGDYDDARVSFEESGAGEPGILSFCTMQDNSSFGADFRISKQERGFSQLALTQTPAAQDEHVLRDSTIATDAPMSGFPAGRAFTIPAAATGSNTHVVYFRHPDYVQCEIIDPATNARALLAYGLEMRMLGPDGIIIAGGNDVTGFNSVYLGDKAQRNNGGNTRYTIEVEATGTNNNAKPYKLHCISGSGHTDGDILRYQEAVDRF